MKSRWVRLSLYSAMPELCRFHGITIDMHFKEHGPPHFHVKYAGVRVLVGIEPIEVLEGRLPPRIRRMVVRWASIHQAELREAWNRAQRMEPLDKIDPLE